MWLSWALQLDIARKHISYHTEKFGYSEPNVEFREGYIENLGAAGIKDQTFDLVMSVLEQCLRQLVMCDILMQLQLCGKLVPRQTSCPP